MKNPMHLRRNSVLLAISSALILFTSAYTSADDLDFSVISQPKPVSAAAASAPERPQLDFGSLSRRKAPTGPANPLNFSGLAVRGPARKQVPDAEQPPVLFAADEPEQKPVVTAYGDLATCPPCRDLEKEYRALTEAEREKLPFRLEHKPLPPGSPVKYIPRLEYTDSQGVLRAFDFSTYKSRPKSLLREFERVYRSNENAVKQGADKLKKTTAAGRRNHRDRTLAGFRGQRRQVAASAYNLALAKLHENPEITREELQESVQGDLQAAGVLPPGLLALLLPVIEFVITQLLNYFRPAAAAPEPFAFA